MKHHKDQVQVLLLVHLMEFDVDNRSNYQY